jgi:predicted Zn-dependent protease
VRKLVNDWGERGLTVTVLTPAAVPGNVVAADRGQVDAPTLIRYMGILFPDAYRDQDAVLIGLTPVDLYDKESDYRYVFGMKGTVTDPKAVISTFRMDPATYGDSCNDELLFARSGKLLTRYIGLLYYGLPLSSNRRSPLYENILGLKDLDNIEEDLPLPQASPFCPTA